MSESGWSCSCSQCAVQEGIWRRCLLALALEVIWVVVKWKVHYTAWG